MNDLHQVGILNGVIRGCIVDPELETADGHPNTSLFSEVEWYLTCRQIAHAGDTYNTYCQRILAEILEADTSIFNIVSKHLRPKSDRLEVIQRLKIQRQTDNNVREALRDSLALPWCNEVEIICELRNKVVHQCGWDTEGKVAEKAEEFSPGQYWLKPTDLDPKDYPIDCAADGKLVIDARAAHWATRWVEHHIHMMDQTICGRFGVPRSRKKPPSSSFRFRDGTHTSPFPPGMPLPSSPPPKQAETVPPLSELHDPTILSPMASPEEIACNKTWHQLKGDLDSFVRDRCQQDGIEIRRTQCNLAGRPLGHTIANHEYHLGYGLSNTGESTERNFLGIRLRQQDFKPIVTVWSTKTRMHDFDANEALDQAKDEIITALHATPS